MNKGVFHLILTILLPYISYTQVLRGKVQDASTLNPLNAATITLVERELNYQTDSNGYFQIDLTSVSSTFHLIIQKQNYLPIRISLTHTLQDTSVLILLDEKHVELDEVEIKSVASQASGQVVSHVEIKKLGALTSIPANSLGDAIATIPGVYNSSTGTGIYKPVIRGLSGSRVVTYLNGIRLENQQWGGDHGLGIIDAGMEQVEVIKGPASLMFGTDALGGILYFSDEKYASQGKTGIFIQQKFETNALLSSSTIGIKSSLKKLRFTAYFANNSAADYRNPSGHFVKNTRYNQQLGKLSFGFSRKRYVSNIRYSFAKIAVGIPGHSHDSSPDIADFYSDKTKHKITLPYQDILNQVVSWDQKIFLKNHELFLVLGNTTNSLKEFEEKFTIPGLSMLLNTSSYQFRHKWHINSVLQLISGFQGLVQINKNRPDAEEQIIPNTHTLDNGIYSVLQASWKKTSLQLGLRGDIRTISCYTPVETIRKSYPGLTYSAGMVHHFSPYKIRLNITSGFRAPHSSELLSNGVHHGSMRYEIGDLQLKIELAHQLDVTFEREGEHVSFVINPFINWISNFIYIEPSDSTINNFPVYYYKSATSAVMYGIDAGIHIHPHFAHWLHWESNFSYIHGAINSQISIPLLPPTRILNTIRFAINVGKTFKFDDISIAHAYYFPQRQVADFEKPSVDYHLLDAGLRCSWHKNKSVWSFQAGVKNILNTRYIPHLSRLKNIGLVEPGINSYIAITYKFN